MASHRSRGAADVRGAGRESWDRVWKATFWPDFSAFIRWAAREGAPDEQHHFHAPGSAFHMSITFFQVPSSCFRQTVSTLLDSVTRAPDESLNEN
jgi:hypothetical protein